MLVDTTFVAAFLVGLLGGVHCVGMCGGIVGALTFGLPQDLRRRTRALWPYLIAYNGGRLLSYGAAGALMGGLGFVAAHLVDVHRAQLVLQGLAGLFMVALGLYLAGWWLVLTRLENVGRRLWQRVEPLGRRLLPVTTPVQALTLGLLWGWLPCGLVYSVLVWAIAAGSAVDGALLMLSFGLGTLPTLLTLGVVSSWLTPQVRKPWVRRLAGGAVALFGLYTLGLAVRAGW